VLNEGSDQVALWKPQTINENMPTQLNYTTHYHGGDSWIIPLTIMGGAL
jgi:hypothetical protein